MDFEDMAWDGLVAASLADGGAPYWRMWFAIGFTEVHGPEFRDHMWCEGEEL